MESSFVVEDLDVLEVSCPKSIELAIERRKMVLDTAKEQHLPAKIIPDIFNAEAYYQWLSHLFEKGTLPLSVKEKFEKDDTATNESIAKQNMQITIDD